MGHYNKHISGSYFNKRIYSACELISGHCKVYFTFVGMNLVYCRVPYPQTKAQKTDLFDHSGLITLYSCENQTKHYYSLQTVPHKRKRPTMFHLARNQVTSVKKKHQFTPFSLVYRVFHLFTLHLNTQPTAPARHFAFSRFKIQE